MKKILSLTLAVLMVVSMIPTAFAAENQDYSLGTAVTVEGAGGEYTVTVPAALTVNQVGTVTAKGYWAAEDTLVVTAPATIEVTNTETDQKATVNVDFDGIESLGDDLEEMTVTAGISVDTGNTKFGTWKGTVVYNVELIKPSATFSDGVTLSWDELKLEENGTKYGYNASYITDTSLGKAFYNNKNLVSINLPNTITYIESNAFYNTTITNFTIPVSVSRLGVGIFANCYSLTTIKYAGTLEQWSGLSSLEDEWNQFASITEVICSDGTVSVTPIE